MQTGTKRSEGPKKMRKRRKMSRKGSRKLFRKTANRMHKFNDADARPMRGGIRL